MLRCPVTGASPRRLLVEEQHGECSSAHFVVDSERVKPELPVSGFPERELSRYVQTEDSVFSSRVPRWSFRTESSYSENGVKLFLIESALPRTKSEPGTGWSFRDEDRITSQGESGSRDDRLFR